MNFNNQWVEIFRAGNYGPKGNWTPEKLAAVVANFKSGIWKPPAVLGHPKDDSPAMGWVEDLSLNEGVLSAKFEQVQQPLEDHVVSGRYPNRSAAFYLDPDPGKGPVLRHVGFLGATPPEVKGLAPIKFSDGEFVAIEFKEEVMDPIEIKKTVATGIREFFTSMFAEKKPGEPATFTEEQVQQRIEAANKPLLERMDKLSSQFDESVKKANDASAAATVAARQASVADFIKARKAANQWVPAFTEAGLEKVLEHMAVSGGVVKFGEAGKEKDTNVFDLFTGFLEKLPKIVPTGEIATMAAGDGEMKPHLVARKATEYMNEQEKKGITVSAAEAVDHVTAKK